MLRRLPWFSAMRGIALAALLISSVFLIALGSQNAHAAKSKDPSTPVFIAGQHVINSEKITIDEVKISAKLKGKGKLDGKLTLKIVQDGNVVGSSELDSTALSKINKKSYKAVKFAFGEAVPVDGNYDIEAYYQGGKKASVTLKTEKDNKGKLPGNMFDAKSEKTKVDLVYSIASSVAIDEDSSSSTDTDTIDSWPGYCNFCAPPSTPPEFPSTENSQSKTISVWTDRSSYITGERVIVQARFLDGSEAWDAIIGIFDSNGNLLSTFQGANYFFFTSEFLPQSSVGTQSTYTVKAVYNGETAQTTFKYTQTSFTVQTDKETYLAGENIKVTGSLSGTTLSKGKKLTVEVYSPQSLYGQPLASNNVAFANIKGDFSYDFTLSGLSAINGVYKVVAIYEADDAYNPIVQKWANELGSMKYLNSIQTEASFILEGSQIDTIDTGFVSDGITGIAMNAKTGLLYVASWNAMAIPVIDTDAGMVVDRIELGDRAGAVAVKEETNTIYATNAFTNKVSVIDGNTHSVTAVISVGGAPINIAYNPYNEYLYTSNQNTHDVTVIDTNTNSVIATIPVGKAPHGLTANPSNGLVYVACFVPGYIDIIDGTKVIGSISSNAVVDVALDPGRQILYAAKVNDMVDVFDVKSGSNKLLDTIAFPPVDDYSSQVGDIVYNSANGNTYVAVGGKVNAIAVIDGKTSSLSGYVYGTGIGLLATDPDGKLYVASGSSKKVYVAPT